MLAVSHSLFALVVCATFATAQGINIDIAGQAPLPANWGAVTGAVGTWNLIPATATNAPLVELGGGATSATITCSPPGTHHSFGNSSTWPPTILFKHSQELGWFPSSTYTWTVTGLTNGDYLVTFYSSTLSPVKGGTTEFSLLGGAFGPQTCTTPWPSYDHFGYGRSFVQDVTNVTNGSLSWTARTLNSEGFFSGLQIEPVVPGEIRNYCYAVANSLGCVPTIFTTGSASLSTNSLRVKASDEFNNKLGILLWSAHPAEVPASTGYHCVAPPLVRAGTQDSGGNPPPGDCSGTYSFHFSSSYAALYGLDAGDTIWCQYWSRDPGAIHSTARTAGVRITFAP